MRSTTAKPDRCCRWRSCWLVAGTAPRPDMTKAPVRCGQAVTWAVINERMTGIEPAYSAWEPYGDGCMNGLTWMYWLTMSRRF
jgi:hypothetical protein